MKTKRINNSIITNFIREKGHFNKNHKHSLLLIVKKELMRQEVSKMIQIYTNLDS
jgi:hypothetical protein